MKKINYPKKESLIIFITLILGVGLIGYYLGYKTAFQKACKSTCDRKILQEFREPTTGPPETVE